MGPYQFKEEDAERFAASTGIKFFRIGRELTFAECPYCSGRSRDKKTFAINLDTGRFNCFRASCGAKGNMITLAKDFNFSLGQNADEYYKPARRYKSWKRPEAPIEPKGAELIYLGDRGISEQIVRKYQITSKDADIIVFPHIDENGDIQTIKYRNAHPEEGQSKEFFERNCRPILFGMYQCNLKNKTLIVTEGQIDALSVAEAGIENAVSVPGGVNSYTWIPYCWNWVCQFDRIIVFGDHEKGKITLYPEFLSRWKDKVWCVRAEDYLDCKDANDILRKYGTAQIRKCIDNAQQPPVTQIIEIADVQDVGRVLDGFVHVVGDHDDGNAVLAV
jgi:DNA primase